MSDRKIKLLYTVDVPLVGARGGKIKFGLNAKNAFINFSGKKGWMFDKRLQTHFLKYIKRAIDERAYYYDFRIVKFTRYMTTRHKIMDRDNYIGGFKPVADALTIQHWIYDDHPDHAKFIYKQDTTMNKEHSIEIKIGKYEDTI